MQWGVEGVPSALLPNREPFNESSTVYGRNAPSTEISGGRDTEPALYPA